MVIDKTFDQFRNGFSPITGHDQVDLDEQRSKHELGLFDLYFLTYVIFYKDNLTLTERPEKGDPIVYPKKQLAEAISKISLEENLNNNLDFKELAGLKGGANDESEDNYYMKYLKYKAKYLKLKSENN